MSTLNPRHKTPPGWALLATSCGTAVASVCALGLFAIESLVGGLWSPLAVLIAGGLCLLLARRIAHLYQVLPSGAGLLAQLSRGLGRRAGLLLVVPYLTLTLMLVGAEATLSGVLLSRILPLPPPVGAALFLCGTWALCRAGLHLGELSQALCTAALMLGLGALAFVLVREASIHDQLSARLLTPAPSAAAFVAAVGQALFLFMGFELVTFQAAGGQPRRVRLVLHVSVVLLAGFYSLVSLGISCLPVRPAPLDLSQSLLAPQLLLAQRGGPLVVIAVVVLSLLASYTSFNGALLTLSRFAYALASQGLLPSGLARIDPRTQVPRRALDGLLIFSLTATALLMATRALLPAIVAAACGAAMLYAGTCFARERGPFGTGTRPLLRRFGGYGLGLTLVGLGIGALIDAPEGGSRATAVTLVALAYLGSVLLLRRPRPGAQRPPLVGQLPVLAPHEGGDHAR